MELEQNHSAQKLQKPLPLDVGNGIIKLDI